MKKNAELEVELNVGTAENNKISCQLKKENYRLKNILFNIENTTNKTLNTYSNSPLLLPIHKALISSLNRFLKIHLSLPMIPSYFVIFQQFPIDTNGEMDRKILHKEKLPGSIYCKDDKGSYLYCNDFVLKMANCKNYSEIINKTDFDMPWYTHAEEVRKLDKKVMSDKSALEVKEYPTVNNKPVIMLTRKVPFFDEEDNVVGIIGVSVDITEHKSSNNNGFMCLQ